MPSARRLLAVTFAVVGGLSGPALHRMCGAEPAQTAKTTADTPWTYRPPGQLAPPVVKDRHWVGNPLDAFVLAKLEENGLTPAVPAERVTLIRRVSFDLTGLPPTPEEVEGFLSDRAPDAYERLVDRLLASPRYGERWAIYWLDLVRFAESDGFKSDDPRPTAWRYRDYVIDSLNRDKPYDRFVQEQVAGDELFPDDAGALVATGFCRHFPDEYNAVNLEQRRQDILNDLTDTTGQVFLGLTLGCARCHDHKFDPIQQSDYYRIQAFFAAFKPAEVPVGSREEVERYRQQMHEWEEKTAPLRKQMAELEEPVRGQFQAKRKARFPKEYQAMYDLPSAQRSPFEQQIAAMVAKQVDLGSDEIVKSMKGEVRQKWQDLGKQMAALAPPRLDLARAMTMTDVGPVAPATHLLRRGDWQQRDREVAPGFLSAIEDRTADIPAPTPGSSTTGRRAVLAKWLTKPDNPLLGRVMMNRLWQHHFGRGIVGTPSDFGIQGEPPSHPELLDWLAAEFIARGWSLKAMHRLMVTSATYQQSNTWNQAAADADPENRLLWRMNRRRLEGETLRDAMLALSGQLNLKTGGPSVYPELPSELGGTKKKEGWPVSADPAERHRRSVYVFVKRNQRYPLFSIFDAPDSNESCARRHVSTTAPQALSLLNSKTSVDQARVFASRLLREVGSAPEAVVARAVWLALGRPAYSDEQSLLLSYLAREAALLRERLDGIDKPPLPLPPSEKSDPAFESAVVSLCHAMLNLNEFLYVD